MMKWLLRVLNLLQRILSVDKTVVQKDSFPSVFFRGISNEDDLDNDVYLKSSAFLFGRDVPKDRTDGNRELSVVWDDCKEALETLLRQRKTKGDGLQFPCGYATITLSRFEDTVLKYITGGLVSYERKPICGDTESGIEDNPYHGNILLHMSASEQQKKNIQHALATIAEFTRRKD